MRSKSAYRRPRSGRKFNLRRTLTVLLGAAVAGLAAGSWEAVIGPRTAEAARPAAPVHFGLCHRGGGTNCVVDGDSFWMDGKKIRVADIDAPETHPPRCAEERRLGDAATRRLQALLNDGPITLAVEGRDTDRYGRKLRVVMRDGDSLGDQLVEEGLARPWEGRRRPWC